MVEILENYITLSLTDCKRLGYFTPQAVASGSVTWNRNGRQVAAVGFATDTRGVPYAKLSYTYNGTAMEYKIFLRWKNSNLNTEQGYYYFVCPVTGRLCRKLYLVNGRFVSRHAVPALYERQTQSHNRRTGIYRVIEYGQAAEELTAQKYRRETYRGKLTPYGRKLQRLTKKITTNAEFLNIGRTPAQ